MIRGPIAESESFKGFLKKHEKFFANNYKVETSSVLSVLIYCHVAHSEIELNKFG